MVSKQKALRVARDKQFRDHSRDALSSAGKAVCRARRVQRPDRKTHLALTVAVPLVAGSIAVWAWRSLKSQ